MTARRPPRPAVWLLTQCLPEDDPLTGDLVEDFTAGRSAVWFWRQALVAVAGRNAMMRARWQARVGGLVTVTLLAGALASMGRSTQRPPDLPEVVWRFTASEIIESSRAGLNPWRLPGTFEVTGVNIRDLNREEQST